MLKWMLGILAGWLVATSAWPEPTCNSLLLSMNAAGQITAGSRKAVLAAAERGDALRVGWRIGWGKGPNDNVLHWANAAFVTVFEGEVFAQMPPIHAQAPVPGKAHVVLTKTTHTWIASIGTDGQMVSRFNDEADLDTRNVEQTWCLADSAGK